MTLSSDDAQDVIVNLSGRGALLTYAPVMQPVDSAYINLTQFRADWSDQTPAENVASYTLEVKTKPLFELLESADFSDVPDALTEDGTGLADISGNYWDYLPEGWTATSYLGAYDNALILAYDGTVKSPTYNLTGYGKVTVVIKAASYYYSNSHINVYTSLDSKELTLSDDMINHTVVLDCAASDAVTIKSVDNYSSVKHVDIYAGEQSESLMATETGNETYRLITDITDRFYTVQDLVAEGTYVYKVKAVYVDGTESDWSNKEEVTLFENGHGYALGDVNHDGRLNIDDVTDLINYLLTEDGSSICPMCADAYGDGRITIDDVTELIYILLTGK